MIGLEPLLIGTIGTLAGIAYSYLFGWGANDSNPFVSYISFTYNDSIASYAY